MKNSPMKRMLGIASLLTVAAGAVTACSTDYPVLSKLAPAKINFSATLLGANEVPAVTTTAAGVMNLTKEDSVSILYTISTTSATDSVTMVHIHAGAAGATGPIMVWFFPSEAARAPGSGGGTAASVNGVVRVGRITRAGTTFVAPFTWDSLQTRLGNATAYVNLHTRKNGSGEIRGQVVPVP